MDETFSSEGYDNSGVGLGFAGDLGNDTSTLDGGIDYSLDPGAIDNSTAVDSGAYFSDAPSGLTQTNGNSGGFGSFFSGLANDASTIIGGAVKGISQSQQIAQNRQLQANGYTIPLYSPGLGGSFNTSSLLMYGLIAALIILLFR